MTKPSELLKQAMDLCNDAEATESNALSNKYFQTAELYRTKWEAEDRLTAEQIASCEQNANDTIQENPEDFTSDDFWYLCWQTAIVEFDIKVSGHTFQVV